jgi:lysophospholipase L1-like esterase
MPTTRKIARSRLLRSLRPRTIVPAGDSITAGSSVLATGTGGPEYAANIAEAGIYTAGMRVLYNAGVAGDTAAALRARFLTDVVAKSPDATFIMIGTNNFVSGMANSAYATLFNDIEACVLMALDANILPIIATPPPKNGAVAESKRAQPFYYWLAEYYGLPLIDVYRLMVDPTNGQFASGYSGDGTHPGYAGIAAVFPAVGAQLSDLPSLIGPEYRAAVSESSTGDLANMVRNGSFALGSAPSSITGWTTNTTNNTITLENPTLPETGKVSKHVVSADGAIYLLNGTSITVTAGNEIIVSGQIKTSGIVATSGSVHVSLDLAGGERIRPIKGWMQNGTFKFSAKAAIPSGKTSITPSVYIDKAGTYEISNLTVIDRTAMAAIWQPGVQGL